MIIEKIISNAFSSSPFIYYPLTTIISCMLLNPVVYRCYSSYMHVCPIIISEHTTMNILSLTKTAIEQKCIIATCLFNSFINQVWLAIATSVCLMT